jgi:hypothetical protein
MFAATNNCNTQSVILVVDEDESVFMNCKAPHSNQCRQKASHLTNVITVSVVGLCFVRIIILQSDPYYGANNFSELILNFN